MSEKDRPPGVAGMLPEQIESKADAKSEKILQEQVANWLRQRNVWFCRSRMDRKTSNGKGTPDFLTTWTISRKFSIGLNEWWTENLRLPVAIECKSGRNGLTAEQIQVRAEMEFNGWKYLLCRSLPELICFLNELGSSDPTCQKSKTMPTSLKPLI